MHTFKDVYAYVSQLILTDDCPDSKVFKIDTWFFAEVSYDCDENIMVNIYEDEDLEEQNDGGGCCILNTFDEDFDDDGDYYDEATDLDTRTWTYILAHGTEEQICQLVTDKALFVWQLIFTA